MLLHNAQEMLAFTRGEEQQLERAIKSLHDAGLRVVVAGATVGELALHYLNRFGILVVKVLSKFDLRRLCRVVGATPLARLGAPMPDEMGKVDVVETLEIGGDRVTVFRQEDGASSSGSDSSGSSTTRTATIVLRGATQSALDDAERAVDDGVNVVKALSRDERLVPGAGATELQLAQRVGRLRKDTPVLAQYAISKYAEAFEVVPRTLAESAGLDATAVLGQLYKAHSSSSSGGGGGGGGSGGNGSVDGGVNGSTGHSNDDAGNDDGDNGEGSGSSSSSKGGETETAATAGAAAEAGIDWAWGVDIENDANGSDGDGTLDAHDEGILDLLATKSRAIRLATEAARTVLSVDQIIVARPAGGPKPPGPNPNWDED